MFSLWTFTSFLFLQSCKSTRMNKLQAVLSFIRNNHDSWSEMNVSGKKVYYDICAPIVTRNFFRGRAIALAASPWLPTAASRLRSQVKSCGICGGQKYARAGFLPVIRFLLPVLIPPTAPHSSSIIQGWYNRPISGRRTKWTQSHPKLKKKIKNKK
jgi:hypothetical protein